MPATTEYFSFAVDCHLSAVKFVTVLSTEQDARTDALTAVMAEFGSAARIVGGASRSYGPDPVADVPSKKCVSHGQVWAWFGCAT